MKVVKVIKSYRNGSSEHFLVFAKDMDDESITDNVEYWCDKDPNGHSYGYSYSWEVVEDKKIIQSVIKDKINEIDIEIKNLSDEKLKMEDFLYFRDKQIDKILT